VELGPGTGPVTKALIERGVSPERLVLVEYEGAFCRLLSQRFPHARLIQGDAYRLSETLAALSGQTIAAIVSSLPLLNQSPARRAELFADAFSLMGPCGVFVQFTYGLLSPAPRQVGALRLTAESGAPIWLNLPPARVWTYRAGTSGAALTPSGRLHEKACAADEWTKRAQAAARALKQRQAKLSAKATAGARSVINEARRSKAIARLRDHVPRI
jgi:phosphatidylethanolamine/phosphatidyl-N-methylethanolamine N-methyltransferase